MKRSLEPAYFEALYAADPDPWRFATSAYEREKYTATLAALPMLHKDPFDRILIAQAEAEGLALITSDTTIAQYSIRTHW